MRTQNATPDRLLNSAEVMSILNIKRTKFWNLRKSGIFPDPITGILQTRLQWKESDIQNWIGNLH